MTTRPVKCRECSEEFDEGYPILIKRCPEPEHVDLCTYCCECKTDEDEDNG